MLPAVASKMVDFRWGEVAETLAIRQMGEIYFGGLLVRRMISNSI